LLLHTVFAGSVSNKNTKTVSFAAYVCECARNK